MPLPVLCFAPPELPLLFAPAPDDLLALDFALLPPREELPDFDALLDLLELPAWPFEPELADDDELAPELPEDFADFAAPELLLPPLADFDALPPLFAPVLLEEPLDDFEPVPPVSAPVLFEEPPEDFEPADPPELLPPPEPLLPAAAAESLSLMPFTLACAFFTAGTFSPTILAAAAAVRLTADGTAGRPPATRLPMAEPATAPTIAPTGPPRVAPTIAPATPPAVCFETGRSPTFFREVDFFITLVSTRLHAAVVNFTNCQAARCE